MAVHAVAGGLASEAFGGDFRSGALSAGFAAGVGGFLESKGWAVKSTKYVVVRIVSGGIAAELGGGKFANGAVTAGFAYLMNDLNKFSGKDRNQMRARARLLYNHDQVEDVYAHGDQMGPRDEKGRLISVDQMKDQIRSDPHYEHGMVVKLWACNLANGAYPQNLANVLDVPVIAPTSFVWYDLRGTPPTVNDKHYDLFWSGDHETWRSDAYPGKSGSWRTFYPEGWNAP